MPKPISMDYNLNIVTPYAEISVYFLQTNPSDLLTLQQAERITAKLNAITNGLRPQGTVWGYEPQKDGFDLTLGHMCDKRFFSYRRPDLLSMSEAEILIAVIRLSLEDQEHPDCQPFVTKKFERDKGYIAFNPKAFIRNMGLEGVGRQVTLAAAKRKLLLKQWRKTVRGILPNSRASWPPAAQRAFNWASRRKPNGNEVA